MKLIFGLGNPGKKYENTRHNAGVLTLERLAKNLGCAEFKQENKFQSDVALCQNKVILAKPRTFMNVSGQALAFLSAFYKLRSENIYVIHDDLDLVLGTYKIQFAKEPKIHNGIISINRALGTKNYWRVRVGIDARKNNQLPAKKLSGEDYVLAKMEEIERKTLDKTITEVCLELIKIIG